MFHLCHAQLMISLVSVEFCLSCSKVTLFYILVASVDFKGRWKDANVMFTDVNTIQSLDKPITDTDSLASYSETRKLQKYDFLIIFGCSLIF